MKHIFTVHSPITFLCAQGVVKHLDLKEKDVIVISSGYEVPFELGTIVKPFNEFYSGTWNRLFKWNMPKEFDKYINSLTQETKYVAYIDLMHYWQRILVSNKNCIKFNFIEEGMASYHKPDTLEEITFLIKHKSFRFENKKEYLQSLYMALRSFNQRLLNLPYWPFSYLFIEQVNYYCFSPECYAGVPEKRKTIVSFHSKRDGLALENAIIWVEDIYNKRHVSSESLINEAISNAVKFIDSKYGKDHKHYVKLRPNGSLSNSEIVPILKKYNINYEVIKTKEPLELVLERSINIILVSATSSLLYYAKLMGHESYTYFFELKHRKYSAFEGMDFYWTSVKKISNQ